MKDIFLSTTGLRGAERWRASTGNIDRAGQRLRRARPGNATAPATSSQLPFLILHAHNAEPDSIHRGVSMNLDVLCAALGPPAGNPAASAAACPGRPTGSASTRTRPAAASCVTTR